MQHSLGVPSEVTPARQGLPGGRGAPGEEDQRIRDCFRLENPLRSQSPATNPALPSPSARVPKGAQGGQDTTPSAIHRAENVSH